MSVTYRRIMANNRKYILVSLIENDNQNSFRILLIEKERYLFYNLNKFNITSSRIRPAIVPRLLSIQILIDLFLNVCSDEWSYLWCISWTVSFQYQILLGKLLCLRLMVQWILANIRQKYNEQHEYNRNRPAKKIFTVKIIFYA